MTPNLQTLAGFVAVLALVVGYGRAAAVPGAQANLAETERQRETWQRVPELFQELGVREGAVVADVGAGNGFATVRLSRAVGATGRVFSVDIRDETITRLRQRVVDEQLANVTVVKGDADNPKLADASVDAVLVIDAYHEMTEPHAMLAHLRRALKPGGRLVVVERTALRTAQFTRQEQTKNHNLTQALLRVDLERAGFRIDHVVNEFTRYHPESFNDVEYLVRASTGETGASYIAVLSFGSR